LTQGRLLKGASSVSEGDLYKLQRFVG